MVGGNGNIMVGTPEVDGANVVAEILEHGRGEKIVVFKYKNKTRYRRRQGHRQDFTRIAIKEISAGGETARAEAPKSRPTKKSRASKAQPEEEPAAAIDAVIEAEGGPEAEAPAKPTRAKKAPKAEAEIVETATPAGAEAELTTESEATAEAESLKKPARATKPKTEAKAPAKRTPASKTRFKAKKPKAEAEADDEKAEE